MCVLILLLAMSPLTLAAEPKKEMASKAEAAYAASLAEAQAAFNLTATEAHKKLKAEMEKDLQSATKAADLDRAVSIRDRLRKMEEDGADIFKEGKRPIGAKPKMLPGTWRIEYTPNGTSRTIKVVNEIGLFESDGKRYALKSFGESWLFDCGSDRVERWTFANGRLFVEHFFPANTFPGKPNQIGIGVITK